MPDTARRQVVEWICARIEDGTHPVGDRLLTYQALAIRLQVSLTPVRGAVDHLRSRGVLRTEAGRGIFVNRRPTVEDVEAAPPSSRRLNEVEARQRSEILPRLAGVEKVTADLGVSVEALRRHVADQDRTITVLVAALTAAGIDIPDNPPDTTPRRRRRQGTTD